MDAIQLPRVCRCRAAIKAKSPDPNTNSPLSTGPPRNRRLAQANSNISEATGKDVVFGARLPFALARAYHPTFPLQQPLPVGFKCGIVGLPNVGKSTLFNALTQTAAAQAANYPFCTIDPNVGDVAVPDPRLDSLAAIASRRRSSRAARLSSTSPGSCAAPRKAKGSAISFSPTSANATRSRTSCAVSRTTTSPMSKAASIRSSDIDTVETELMLADLESLERRIVPMEKKAKGGDKEAKETARAVERCLAELREGKPARALGVGGEERQLFQSLGLLSSKPVLYVGNVDEASADEASVFRTGQGAGGQAKARGRRRVGEDREEIARACRRRADGLPRRDRADEPGLNRVIRAGYDAPASRHLLHRRPEGGPRLDGRARAQKRRRPPESSTPISRKASSALRPSPMTIMSVTAAKRVRASPAESGSKARIMSSPTVTSCISASPIERHDGRGARALPLLTKLRWERACART